MVLLGLHAVSALLGRWVCLDSAWAACYQHTSGQVCFVLVWLGRHAQRLLIGRALAARALEAVKTVARHNFATPLA